MFVVKKNSEMMNKTFRLPVDLLERLTEVAKAQEVSVNNLVQQCCEYALGEMPKSDSGRSIDKSGK